MPFTTAHEILIIKCKLIKPVQNLYAKNYKTHMRDIKDQIINEEIYHVHELRDNAVEYQLFSH